MTKSRDIADSINRIDSSAADATAMTIDANENVGIGTSPDTKLHIDGGSVGSGSGEVAIKMSLTANTISARNEIRSGNTNGTNPYMSFAVRETSSPFATVERMRLTSDGNFGIGSTVPKGRLTIQKNQAGSSTSGTGTTLTFNGNAGSGNPWEIYRDNGNTGDLVFCQDVSDTRSEAIRIRLAGGGITFNGDTAEANALDDYEEGSWTPGFDGMTFSSASGVYTKIGRRVHCSGFISGCNSGTASGVAAKLNGLPFTVSNSLASTSLEDGGIFQYWADLGVTASVVTIAPDDSSTECFLYYADGSGSSTLNGLLRTAIDTTNFNCRISFTYIST